MSLLARLFVIAFGFIAACLVAGAIVVFAVLFPELSALDTGAIDPNALNILLGFGFVFVSGFALIPALLVALITEVFAIRAVLVYAVSGAAIGALCYLGLLPWNPATSTFEGFVQRHLEIMAAAGILAGVVYWMVAGRKAGAWRKRPPPLNRAP
jgi:hypothetical protein